MYFIVYLLTGKMSLGPLCKFTGCHNNFPIPKTPKTNPAILSRAVSLLTYSAS